MRSTVLAFTLAVTPLLGACTGEIDGSVDDPGTMPATGTGSPGSPMAGPASTASCGTRAPIVRAFLLSPSQYNHTVQDLFRVEGDFSKNFGGGVAGPPDELGIELRANAAAQVALLALKSLAQWSPCDPVKAGDAACARQIVDQLGPRAFRRPLVEAEKTQLNALFAAGVKEKDFATGIDWLLTGLLQSPDFLYRTVKPAANEKPGQIVALDDHQLASRLAFFLWDGPPDDRLLAAAAARELTDPTRSQALLERMLHDPRAARAVQEFYESWLGMQAFGEVARDDRSFTNEIVTSLRTSLIQTVMAVHNGAGNLDGLFTGQSYPLNGPLRRFYGIAGMTNETFAPTDLPNRRGLLTHPALTTLLARPDATNPIARGMFMRRNLLCQEFEVPPGLDIPALPTTKANVSTRERFVAHSAVPACAGCHGLIDPPGFALEGFDAVGKWRTTEAAKPIDSSGVMIGAADLNGPFANGDELLKRFTGSQVVRTCVAKHYLEHALERVLGEDDQCSLERLQKSFAATGDLKSLILAVARSDSFRFRQTEGAAQ